MHGTRVSPGMKLSSIYMLPAETFIDPDVKKRRRRDDPILAHQHE